MEYVCFEVNLHHVEEIEGKFGIKVNFESFLKYEDNVTMKQLIKSKLNFIEKSNKFNSSKRTKREKFLTMYFSKG